MSAPAINYSGITAPSAYPALGEWQLGLTDVGGEYPATHAITVADATGVQLSVATDHINSDAILGAIPNTSMFVSASSAADNAAILQLWQYADGAVKLLHTSGELTGSRPRIAQSTVKRVVVKPAADGLFVAAVPVRSGYREVTRWVMAVLSFGTTWSSTFYPDTVAPALTSAFQSDEGFSSVAAFGLDMEPLGDGTMLVSAQYGVASPEEGQEGIRGWAAIFNPGSGLLSGDVQYQHPILLSSFVSGIGVPTYAIPAMQPVQVYDGDGSWVRTDPAPAGDFYASIYPASLMSAGAPALFPNGSAPNTVGGTTNIYGSMTSYDGSRLVSNQPTSPTSYGSVSRSDLAVLLGAALQSNSWSMSVKVAIKPTNAFVGACQITRVAPVNSFIASLPVGVDADLVFFSTNYWQCGVTLPVASAVGEFSGAGSWRVSAKIPRIDQQATLIAGGVWRATARIPSLASSISLGAPVTWGVVAAVRIKGAIGYSGGGLFDMSAAVPVSATAYYSTVLRGYGYCMGPSAAVAEHSMPATSYALVGGKLLVAGPSGLHVMDSADDNGAKVMARLKTRSADFGSPNVKGLDMIFAVATSAGRVSATVTADSAQSNTYLSPAAIYRPASARRIAPGRGVRGRWWQIEVVNTDGAYPYQLHALEVVARISETRRSR